MENQVLITKVWEGEDGNLYCEDQSGGGGQVMAGWWHGCSNCGAFKDEIEDIQSEEGPEEACKFALNHLPDGLLCAECLEEEQEEEEEDEE